MGELAGEVFEESVEIQAAAAAAAQRPVLHSAPLGVLGGGEGGEAPSCVHIADPKIPGDPKIGV